MSFKPEHKTPDGFDVTETVLLFPEDNNPRPDTVRFEHPRSREATIIRKLEYTGGVVGSGQREIFLKHLAEGTIDGEEVARLLAAINPETGTDVREESSADRAKKVFPSLFRFEHTFPGELLKKLHPSEKTRFTPEAVQAFLEKYPEPSGMDSRLRFLLGQALKRPTSEAISRGEREMQEFFEVVYGEQYEYWKEIKRLQEEADRKFPDAALRRKEFEISEERNPALLEEWLGERILSHVKKNVFKDTSASWGVANMLGPSYEKARNEDPLVGRLVNRISILRGSYNPLLLDGIEKWARKEFMHSLKEMKPEKKKSRVVIAKEAPEEINELRKVVVNLLGGNVKEAEAARILSRAQIHGDKFLGRKLTSKLLEERGLVPHHAIEVENMRFTLSKPFDIGRGRLAAMGYVESEGGVVLRSFYRSNSHGVWRLLPSYIAGEKGITWYAKGHGESSINLPIVLQRELAILSRKDMPVLSASHEDPKVSEAIAADFQLAFAGTTYSLEDDRAGGTFRRDVFLSPRRLAGNFYAKGGSDSHSLVAPEEVDFYAKGAGERLDLSHRVSAWDQDSKIYGRIRVEAFSSYDRSLTYMVLFDAEGRVWINDPETKAPITTTGVRGQHVRAGSLAVSGFEYHSQSYGYGGASRRGVKEEYVDMYPRYLSRVPVIQEIIRERGVGGFKV